MGVEEAKACNANVCTSSCVFAGRTRLLFHSREGLCSIENNVYVEYNRLYEMALDTDGSTEVNILYILIKIHVQSCHLSITDYTPY